MGSYTKYSVIQSKKFLSKHSKACIRAFVGKEYPDIKVKLISRDGFKVFYFITSESVQCIERYNDNLMYSIYFKQRGLIKHKEVALSGRIEFVEYEKSKILAKLSDIEPPNFHMLKMTAHTCHYCSRFALFTWERSFFPIEEMDLF